MMKPALRMVRVSTAYLPSNNAEDAPVVPSGDALDRLCDELRELVPVNPNVPYDIREIIRAAADERFFFEVAERFAANIVVGFIRLNGRSVGVVANQPAVLAGCLDIGTCRSKRLGSSLL